jgi:cysteine desulfurase
LIVALGKAAELAARDHTKRSRRCEQIKSAATAALTAVGAKPNGDPKLTLPSTLNVSIPGLDSEAVMVALKDLVALSNGSACTSQSYTASHVLEAMQLDDDHIKGALRFSWCHMTPDVNWDAVVGAIKGLQ